MSWEGLKLGLLCTSQAAAWIARYLGWDTVRELTLARTMVLPRLKKKKEKTVIPFANVMVMFQEL